MLIFDTLDDCKERSSKAVNGSSDTHQPNRSTIVQKELSYRHEIALEKAKNEDEWLNFNVVVFPVGDPNQKDDKVGDNHRVEDQLLWTVVVPGSHILRNKPIHCKS